MHLGQIDKYIMGKENDIPLMIVSESRGKTMSARMCAVLSK